jgi:predicted RNase H-like HicB family nuclease
MIVMGDLVVIERGSRGYGAYVPDLPGAGVAGRRLPEVRRPRRRAAGLHVHGLREDGLPVPLPRTRLEWFGVPDASRAGRRGTAAKLLDDERGQTLPGALG